ncbi:hypothetical protein Q7O_001875 [Pectobacterium carotovorum subsp. carotovorum PCCS1]|nr:hypothetical protein KKH3_35320 [Pectobacterium actinidiae]MBG0752423.1 hypothetical protein [Pectobacterium carotovorum subsp. carotovorum PCCS1]
MFRHQGHHAGKRSETISLVSVAPVLNPHRLYAPPLGAKINDRYDKAIFG